MVKNLWGDDRNPMARKADWERRLEKVAAHHHG
jgi:hypothetical protein